MTRMPFCEFCVRSRVLCQKCQLLIDEGKYDWLDVDVAESLLKLSRRFNLSEVEYIKSYEIEGFIVVVLKNIKRISRGAFIQLERELSSILGKQVKIVEYGNKNEIIAQLVSPAKLLTISTSWLPDGTSETVVKIPQRELKRLPMGLERLQEILRRVADSSIKIDVVKERELRI